MAYGPNQAICFIFVFLVNKVLLKHSHAHSLVCRPVYGNFYDTMIEQSKQRLYIRPASLKYALSSTLQKKCIDLWAQILGKHFWRKCIFGNLLSALGKKRKLRCIE